MVAYTGIETISNLAEEATDHVNTIPRATRCVVIAVFAIYVFLPSVALSADAGRERPHSSWRPRTRATRSSASSKNMDLGALQHAGRDLRRNPRGDDPVHRDERGHHRGVAAHLLDGQHRQLPEMLRKLHPKYKTPYVAIIVFGAIAMRHDHPRPGRLPRRRCTPSGRCSRSRSPTCR